MAQPTVSCEKAAVAALGRHLAAGLGPEVQVWDHWPDGNTKVTDPMAPPGSPRSTVTVLLAGERRDELLQPEHTGSTAIHADITPRVVPVADVVDVATAVAALNLAVSTFEAHRVDVGAHVAADTTNGVAAAVATNLGTGITRVNDLAARIVFHMHDDAHNSPDEGTWGRQAGVTWPLQVVKAGDTVGFVRAVLTCLVALNAHFAARADQWTVAVCEQPIQLDVWTGFDVERDSLRARLEPLLHQNAAYADDPVTPSCLVALGDGWQGFADFTFNAPKAFDTADSIRRREFRLTYSGSCALTLSVWAQSPRLASLTLSARLGASQSAIAAAVAKRVTMTPGGTTYTGG